ncbi:tail fiber domain-containing protein [Stenotrophomonas maltophilia]
MFVLANTAGASAVTPAASKTTLFVDASGVPSTKDAGGTVVQLLSGPAAAAAYQPLNANLTGISSVTVANDQALVYTGGSWASYSLTAAGRALSGVAGTANTFPYFSAANVVTLGSVTTTGLSVLSAANQAAARTAIQAVGSVGNETVGGIKTMTSEIRIQNVAPGFWLDESDGSNGFFIVVDSGVMQVQVRDPNFGPYVRQVLQVSATGGTFGIGATNVRPLDTSTANLGITSNRWANVHSDRFTSYIGISPATDNSIDVGTSALRFRTYYGVNSAINTSDARLKTEPRHLKDAEFKAFSAVCRLPPVWRWLSRVHGDESCEPEGQAARKHFGPTVQAAMQVFKDHGLEAFENAPFCYDEWEAEPATYDEEGNELTPAREAGDRYSFRKEELLCGMVSALAREIDEKDAKIEAQQVEMDQLKEAMAALLSRVAALEAKA